MARDLGLEMQIEVGTDSSAGKAIASRRGLGRTRHIDTRFLWVQQKVTNGEVMLTKVKTQDNIADLMTKYVSQVDIERHLQTLGMYFMEGRFEGATEVQGK